VGEGCGAGGSGAVVVLPFIQVMAVRIVAKSQRYTKYHGFNDSRNVTTRSIVRYRE
jgi:hypothetical protein